MVDKKVKPQPAKYTERLADYFAIIGLNERLQTLSNYSECNH